MVRMLGRNRAAGRTASCGLGACRHCRRGDETRRFKRSEARETARQISRFPRFLQIGRPDFKFRGES